jgi:tRNA(Ile)-lysidine synthase
MLDKVLEIIKKHDMIQKGDGIVVGLSGGPDSVCLLHALYSLREKLGINLYAVHLNHMIRGKEAERDEEYSKCFAELLGIPFYSKCIEVEKYAKEHGMSSEEAGRFFRYKLFNEVADEVGAKKIALAHNMNDQAETMIMRFIRGTGISGLGGIKPIRDNKYIRPILSCSRGEIEEYCEVNALNPVIDSTNKESIYTRNRVRLEFIPYIKKHFNPNIIESLYKNSEIFRDENEYIDSMAKHELKKIREKEGINIIEFNKLHTALKKRVIRLMVEDVKGNLNGIEGKHIEECIRLIEKGKTGKTIELPDNINCAIDYSIFKVLKKTEALDYEYRLGVPETIYVREANMYVETKILEDNIENLTDKQFVKYWDCDKIKYGIIVRNRRDGDYIFPKGMEGRKKLKDILIDKKVPREERDRLLIFSIESEVLWIAGVRDSRNYKIDSNTKRVLEIKITKKNNFERHI